jgi:hypothetical protein
MSRIQCFFRAFFGAALLSAAFSVQAQTSDEDVITLGVEVPYASVSLCSTRKKAEAIVKVYIKKGWPAAFKVHQKKHCFSGVLSLMPHVLVSSTPIDDDQSVNIVQVFVRAAGPKRSFYLITTNIVAVGGVRT